MRAWVASAPFAQAESTPSSVTKMKLAATAAFPGAVTGKVGGVVAGAILATIPVHDPLEPPTPGTVGCVVAFGVPKGVAFVGVAVYMVDTPKSQTQKGLVADLTLPHGLINRGS